ncbi:MAG: 50S ribosomal protein L11 methyltransferase [Bacteroidetes bacterium]|nr:50S ribosomal protein L11 methyltransferase [Bacteroidota bacterium]
MKRNKRFLRARFQSTAHDATVQGMLITHDPLGFLEEDQWWEVYFEAELWPAVEVSFLRRLEEEGLTAAYELETFDQQNWNQEWEDSIQPIKVSDRFLITPSWHPVADAEGMTVLIIDPKMSFGTGYHATTRLMLRLMEGLLREGDRVLDVGTGTGVLAIAAVRCGAREADGVDTDEWSYDNALENAQRNGVAEHCHFRLGSIEQANGEYDLILSNITKIDNLQLLPTFLHHLTSGGRIVLSGFYAQDAPDLHMALSNLGLQVISEETEDEWCAVSASKEVA